MDGKIGMGRKEKDIRLELEGEVEGVKERSDEMENEIISKEKDMQRKAKEDRIKQAKSNKERPKTSK